MARQCASPQRPRPICRSRTSSPRARSGWDHSSRLRPIGPRTARSSSLPIGKTDSHPLPAGSYCASETTAGSDSAGSSSQWGRERRRLDPLNSLGTPSALSEGRGCAPLSGGCVINASWATKRLFCHFQSVRRLGAANAFTCTSRTVAQISVGRQIAGDSRVLGLGKRCERGREGGRMISSERVAGRIDRLEAKSPAGRGLCRR